MNAWQDLNSVHMTPDSVLRTSERLEGFLMVLGFDSTGGAGLKHVICYIYIHMYMKIA
jgi:hypothetical protein